MVDGEHCISITEEEMETATIIAFKTKNGENEFRRVKHGHWELNGACSVCGKNPLQSYSYFCCYCGADMR